MVLNIWVHFCRALKDSQFLHVFWKDSHRTRYSDCEISHSDGGCDFALIHCSDSSISSCAWDSNGVGPWESPVQPGSPHTEFRQVSCPHCTKMLTWQLSAVRICVYLFSDSSGLPLVVFSYRIKIVFQLFWIIHRPPFYSLSSGFEGST